MKCAGSGRSSRVLSKTSSRSMTLASIVKNLERKKYVKAKRYGNTYEYRPLIPQEEYKRTFMGSVVNNYFENSYKEMVSFFAKEQKISTDELKEIIDMIEKGRE